MNFTVLVAKKASINKLIAISLIFFIAACGNEKQAIEEPTEKVSLEAETSFRLRMPNQTGLDHKTQGAALYPMDNIGSRSGGSGIAIGDINNDGRMDIFLSGGIINAGLYLNEGNLKFKNITQSAGIKDVSNEMAMSESVNMVDVNGDGWLDLYIVKSGIAGNFEKHQYTNFGANLLYINQKDNTFKEEAAKYGLDIPGLTQAANFFDYDGDGDLDVYLIQTPEPGSAFSFPYYKAKPAAPIFNDYFLENRNGKFVDVRAKAGILYERNIGLSVSVADVNNDGFSDIYVANDFFGADFFYLNQGNKTFREARAEFFSITISTIPINEHIIVAFKQLFSPPIEYGKLC